MVSTRGVKLNFLVGERVLCYEPDPTKAKVLYDSKVLDIIFRKDQIGKKVVEYLIHFQGWSATWDRCVGAEYILKDNPDNRQLQKNLAERSQLQLGAYLYRKERKKHTQQFNRSSESEAGSNSGNPENDKEVISSSEDGNGFVDNNEFGNANSVINNGDCDDDKDDDDDDNNDDDSSVEDRTIEIVLAADLKEIIKTDYYLINKSNKRIKLPVVPNVVSILEKYYTHYVNNQLCGLNEKVHSQYRKYFYVKESKPKTESDIQKNLTICREVIDGIRIYFDFTLNDYLLYEVEKNDANFFKTAVPIATNMSLEEGKLMTSNNNNNSNNHNNNDGNTNMGNVYQNGFGGDNSSAIATGTGVKKRNLRSNNKIENNIYSNGNSNSDTSSEITGNHVSPSSSAPNNLDIIRNGSLVFKTSWKLLPDYLYNQIPPPPCLIYGAIHLTRLFIKLPEFLNAQNNTIPDIKMKIILQHIDLIIDFLNEHKEWYGGKYYEDCN